jgi:hypothetical protein
MSRKRKIVRRCRTHGVENCAECFKPVAPLPDWALNSNGNILITLPAPSLSPGRPA